MNFKFGTLSTTKATLDVNTTSLICSMWTDQCRPDTLSLRKLRTDGRLWLGVKVSPINLQHAKNAFLSLEAVAELPLYLSGIRAMGSV